MRLQIIDEPDRLNADLFRQFERIHNPGKVGSGDASVEDGAGDAEAGTIGSDMFIADEKADDFVQAFVLAAGIDALEQHFEDFTVLLEERDSCVRAADIASKDHWIVVLTAARMFKEFGNFVSW
jgi:hypothetical protein